MTRKKPRLPAYPYPFKYDSGKTGLRIWCCWCDRWHYHGDGYGHRAAHCHAQNPASPYNDTGYMLTSPQTIERVRR